MKNKKIFLIVIALIMSLTLCSCGGSTTKGNTGNEQEENNISNSPEEIFNIRLAHAGSADSHFNYGCERFAELVDEKTGGHVRVDIFPNAVLGSDRDLNEGISLGTIDMVLSGSPNLSQYVPEIQVLTMPYLYRDNSHAHAVVDGPIGQDLFKKLEKFNIIGLSYMENGTRNLTTKTKVLSIEDVKGLKIRTQEVPFQVAFWKQLGADPTPMTFSEVFIALQQGTVDGQENPVALIYTHKFYEVAPYVSLTGHVYEPAALMINKQKFESLPEEYQKALVEASKEATKLQRDYSESVEEEQLQMMEKEGAIIIRTPDVTGFQEIAKSVQTEWAEKLGVKDILSDIQKY